MAAPALSDPPGPATLPPWLALALGFLAAFRLAYHSTYIDVDPFALGTFSDGRIYELAARDILIHPPLGSEPFYLQGSYAYFMAACMAFKHEVAMALLGQVALGAGALWLFFRAAAATFGRTEAGLSTLVLMAYPGLMFYENKFLSAELGVVCNVLVLAAVAGYLRRPSWKWSLGLGVATGLSVLARPNMALAVPFVAATVWVARADRRIAGRHLGLVAGGLLLALAPMAIRNSVVTGEATVFPAHGGGTSFHIGNNPHANGVWNSAGGLITPDVTRERSVLAERLGVEDRADVIGRELYERSLSYIAEHPGEWVALEIRKVWLTVGNTELTQDYDWHGEAELIPWSRWPTLPFGVVLALGALGLGWLWRQPEHRPWRWALGGQIAAVAVATVVFFTSSQHRLPLVVCLAFVSGPGLLAMWRARGRPRRDVVVAAVLFAQALWPRSSKTEPSAIHYFNMAVVQAEVGLDAPALASVSRAVQLRPDNPLVRLEHARLLWRNDHYDEADAELDWLAGLEAAPAVVVEQIPRLRAAVAQDRIDAAREAAAREASAGGD